jgi:hypothetical protein
MAAVMLTLLLHSGDAVSVVLHAVTVQVIRPYQTNVCDYGDATRRPRCYVPVLIPDIGWQQRIYQCIQFAVAMLQFFIATACQCALGCSMQLSIYVLKFSSHCVMHCCIGACAAEGTSISCSVAAATSTCNFRS